MRSAKIHYQRMMTGSSRPVVFMPWYGEYGIMLLYWIRFVHHYKASNKIVCCRPGEEVYFPSASRYWSEFKEVVSDHHKKGALERLNDCQENLALQTKLSQLFGEVEFQFPFREPKFDLFANLAFPLVPSPRRNLKVDLVIGARQRDHRPQRNWPHWPQLIETIRREGYSVGLVGQQATSCDSPLVNLRAWEAGNDASANVEMLQGCKLYVGTDTGTSHLAAFVSTPAVIFRYPDPWSHIDAMKQTSRSHLEVIPTGWEDPGAVLDALRRLLNTMRPGVV